MIWNVNPVFISLGPVEIRYYGIFFMLSFLLGYCLMAWIYKKEGKPINDLDNLLTYVFLGTLIGARLGHVLFYQPDYYFEHPLEIVKIWHGGLASHGAAVGICLALYLFSRNRPQQNFLWVMSRGCIIVALAGFFIRLGNFFNSEIYGVYTTLPWAVTFLQIDNIPRHPTQLYESFSYLLIFLLSFTYYNKFRARVNSRILLGFFFVAVFSARFLLEFTKDYQADFEQTIPLHMGQILSIPLIIIGIALIVVAGKNKRC